MQIVEIEWVDSCTDDNWHDIEYASKKAPVSCKSVGYLIKKSRECVVLGGSISEQHNATSFMTIPRKCIKGIRKL